MEKKFTSDEVPLGQLLEQARTGVLQLPDFQRGWVWDDDHIRSLLASISVSYPIGAVMTLQTGNPDVKFKPRPLEGVSLKPDTEPEFMLLDGQQRTTSLYLALKAGMPVPTRDARGKDLLRRYYADINMCLDSWADREDAIVSVPEDGVVRAFGGDVLRDVSSREKELQSEMFPLDIVLDQSATSDWMLAYLKQGPGDQDARLDKWKAFNTEVINPFVQYQVPTIQLVKSTPKEAVCAVFEKVNTGGVSLTVFELLTATYAADNFNLRDDWAARRQETFQKHMVLKRFEATDFLQILTLLATRERRQAHLETNPEDEKAPAVSCKRRDVLRLSLPDYEKWADVATRAVERVVPFLHGEHVFESRDLPYPTQLVPLGAIFATLGDKAESHGVRQKLRRWYWCGVLGEMYGGSTETRFANDLQDVVAWVGGGEEPRTVKEAQFQADRLMTLRTRNSAAYKGLHALQMERGARDFRTGNSIDIHAYFDDAIDIHHIFPQKWCAENGVDSGLMNSVVNKTAIDAHTNRLIGGKAPSFYLERLEKKAEMDPAELDAILRSHDIDPLTLRQDDFGAFFNHRFERLLKQIGEAMGKPVNRSAFKDESPFKDVETEAELTRTSIQHLINKGESKVVEFKSTLLKNLEDGSKDWQMEWSVAKTIAGFMNANGGTLLVGVADGGSIVGIQEDFPFLKEGDRDRWELRLTESVGHILGNPAAAELDVSFASFDGKDVARIEVGPAHAAVFAVPPKGEKTEQFFVRINNQTKPLVGSEAHEYQKKRWPGANT